MPTIRIVAPEIHAGDAVGNHCIGLARALSMAGWKVSLHAKLHNDGAGEVLDYESLFNHQQTKDILFLSYSTFQPQLQRILRLPGRKIVYFHGVTPVDLLLEHDPVSAYWSSKAIQQLPLLAGFEHIVANSYWNLKELRQYFRDDLDGNRFSVFPPITADMPLFHKAPRNACELGHPLNILTVGRLAPHKKVEDLLHMISTLNRDSIRAKLTIVGSFTSPEYVNYLESVSSQLRLTSTVQMIGHISDEALSKCYIDADLFVSASIHEGFCIPVLEAMHLGLPIIIRRGTAASELAHGAGLEFDSQEECAKHVAFVIDNKDYASKMMLSGRVRSQKLLENSNINHLCEIICA